MHEHFQHVFAAEGAEKTADKYWKELIRGLRAADPLVARGQLFRLSGLWDGAAQPLGASRGVRYTRCAFLYNGHALAVACERGEWRGLRPS